MFLFPTPGSVILTVIFAAMLISGGAIAFAMPLTTLAGLAGLLDLALGFIGLLYQGLTHLISLRREAKPTIE